MVRPARFAVELENAQRAIGILSRHFAIHGLAAPTTKFDWLTESIFPCGDAEAHKHLLTFHFLFSFQVVDGFVDGFNQRARPGQVLLQNVPMRLESLEVFKVISIHDLPDLLQLEPQLPVKQNLLEG